MRWTKRDELAYLAGFFDGEGCISIGRGTGKAYTYGARHQVMAQVAQTSEIPLDMYLERWGGSIFKRSEWKGNQRPMWAWRLHDIDGIRAFCKEIEPFILLKKDQLAICLQFLDTVVGANGHKWHRWNRMPLKVFKERERLYRECSRLKGPSGRVKVA